MTEQKPNVPDAHPPIRSVASGAYDPGPVTTEDAPNPELSYVQSQRQDILPEEFPEGPYGASALTDGLGKSTPWEHGQRRVSAHRDQNPMRSDRQTPTREPERHAPRGSIEGQS